MWNVDTVLVTGDVTHRGRTAELDAFERMFAPLRDRLLVVPGNHDRMGDDAGRRLMSGQRVDATERPGLLVVRLDSTAAHNRYFLDSHGVLTRSDMEGVLSAVAAAPPQTLVVVMLHHHLHPLPEDHFSEKLATFLGWPNAAELDGGRELLDRLDGRCNLILHGHRHAASELVRPPRDGRQLRVFNAGCTPELRRARVVTHAAGRVLCERWLGLETVSRADVRLLASPAAASLQPAA